ncbi:hypothetical protein WJX84_001892 [Apatococcus fuscideae]|uniref:t-SNARE coiled-coil homology domain-containing protein n=1 Tax=Apatococcus fuscideae TaxID=2026836 RepID=A0AAW1SY14_9CHLO
MGEDRSEDFWQAAVSSAALYDKTEVHLNKLRKSRVLLSLSSVSDFTASAQQVDKAIQQLTNFVSTHRRDYVQPGRCSEGERDAIEEQVAVSIRACTQNVGRLRDGAMAGGQSTTAHPNQQLDTHRLGVVLLLNERLKSVSSIFDQCRSARQKQREQQEATAKRRRLSPMSLASSPAGSSMRPSPTASPVPQRLRFENMQADAAPELAPQQQAQLQQEGLELQRDLLEKGNRVQEIGRSVQDISQLNSLFAAQVMQQADQIEQLYSEAVQATADISAGNMQLTKAIRYNTSTRKIMLAILLMASLSLLFWDWFYS